MMEKGKISAAQLACMMYLSLQATATLASPALVYGISQNDMYLTPLLGCLGGFLTVYIAMFLQRQYPGQTLVQYSESILGPWLGKLASLSFLLVCLLMNAYQLRQFSELMNLAFMALSPPAVFSCTMVLVGSIAVRLGVEIIGRLSLLFTPIIVVIVVILVLPLIQGMEPDQLLPFLDKGVMPVVKGAAILQIWFPLFIYSAMFLPYVSNINKAARWLSYSVCWATLTFIITFFYVIMSIGAATQLFSYPFLLLSRYVVIASFMTHLDSLIMIMWVLDVFIRTIVMYYAAASGIAQLCKLPSYKPLILPIGLWIVILSFWSVPDISTFNENIGKLLIFVYSYAHLVIPIILYVAALLRKMTASNKQPPATNNQGVQPNGTR
ncbi:spore germination protein [Paenibacillus curdlanolyticus YK9]|uniref:Spore germination protein n=1 Tax=Paenibacillus curdlanolyticus YK9 TaxID=717606 RepID=E0IEJ4_9BACL|nr:endospore germination permease [Paenibacillus curdlanolyticus]EFM09082.1 spore germination protein [Paenibacillus curdlanolyticus YK9]